MTRHCRWTGTWWSVDCSCSYHTRALRFLRHIRPPMTLDVAKSVGHSIVSSRLDYANALLHGTSTSNLHRLQVAQNSLARAVCQAPRSSATKLRRQLHCYIGFQSGKESATSLPSSLTTPTKPRLRLICVTSFTSTILHALCDLLIYRLLLTVPRMSLILSAKAFYVSPHSVWKSLSSNSTVDLLNF